SGWVERDAGERVVRCSVLVATALVERDRRREAAHREVVDDERAKIERRLQSRDREVAFVLARLGREAERDRRRFEITRERAASPFVVGEMNRENVRPARRWKREQALAVKLERGWQAVRAVHDPRHLLGEARNERRIGVAEKPQRDVKGL